MMTLDYLLNILLQNSSSLNYDDQNIYFYLIFIVYTILIALNYFKNQIHFRLNNILYQIKLVYSLLAMR